ncbi:MAG: hypothetical protein M1833_000768 [Piccolia ochrophora]|nr:MAG: hypothetical protein M1833_000768 [Piccolia ochrophora]
MSEYWKSTPKFWCKHCKVYVRDTKLEKTQHDATPRHQGNLKRFLRDLHRGHEREERDKDRAKQEVERLNSLVSGRPPSAGPSTEAPARRKNATPASSTPQRQVTAEERKRQLAQLAEMGIAVPQEYRGEMAMAGDWQTLSETPVTIMKTEATNGKLDTYSIGVRKRKLDVEEEEEEPKEETRVRKEWGSTIKTYPRASEDDDDDLDNLLSLTKARMETKCETGHSPAETQRLSTTEQEETTAVAKPTVTADTTTVKTEDPEDMVSLKVEPAGDQVFFRKRRSKNIRQK